MLIFLNVTVINLLLLYSVAYLPNALQMAIVSKRPISGVTIIPVPKFAIMSTNGTCTSVLFTILLYPPNGGG